MAKNYSPFSLNPEAESAYQQWREWKLSVYPKKAGDLLVAIQNPNVILMAFCKRFSSKAGKNFINLGM